MSTRHVPRWLRAVQRRLAERPEITELICMACGRSCYLSDWDTAAGTCVDCAPTRAVDDALDSDQPFCEEE